jgi:hypothetical protein
MLPSRRTGAAATFTFRLGAMKPLGRGELKRFLQQLSKEQLINQILELSRSFPQVEDFYQAKVRPADDAAVRQKYKEIVEHEFFPTRGFGKARLSVARKAVTDYKKVAASEDGVADIMLFYVEVGVRFTTEFGDIDEPFYLSMERMYASVLSHIAKHGLEEQFQPRCAHIVEKTQGMAWGFHDTLSDLYGDHFEEEW